MDKIAICNEALQLAGAQPITSVEDANVGAQLCKTLWTGVRDEALEEHAWTFATKRLALARENTTPASGYLYQYLLPSSVIRVLAVADGDDLDIDWRLEDRRVLCDVMDGIVVHAVVQVDETNRWSPKFTQAVAYLLATKICIALSENRALRGDLVQLYRATLEEASRLDGVQGRAALVDGMTPRELARYG